MSLAWMINKYDFIIPIPGSRKLERLQSNFEAGNVELSQEEVKTIDDKLNTRMEFLLVCIGYNLRKYHNYRIKNKKKVVVN